MTSMIERVADMIAMKAIGVPLDQLTDHYQNQCREIAKAAIEAMREPFDEFVKRSYSHVDGRDLFAEIHPRKSLDIVRRIDGVETLTEGDWLTELGFAIRETEKQLDAALKEE